MNSKQFSDVAFNGRQCFVYLYIYMITYECIKFCQFCTFLAFPLLSNW